MKRSIIVSSMIVSLSIFQAVPFAADTAGTKIAIGAMAAIENGRFVSSHYAGASLPYKPWINDEYLRISLRSTLSDHLQFIVAPEMRMWFDNYDWNQMDAEAFAFPFTSHTTVSLANAQGIMTYGDKQNYSIEFAAGVMPYKYNNSVKNLGEYLFRSGCHPAYVVTSFDNAYATLTGFRLSSTMFNQLSLDLFLSTETVFLPTLDWSASLLAGYKPIPGLEFGAGVMFHRLFPVDSTRERPSNPKTSDFTTNGYQTSNGDTGYFSFAGTKVMARFSFDPKEAFEDLFPDGLFGKEDGKIYAEAAVLGVKSITAYGRLLDTNGMPIGGGLIVDSSKNFYSDITQRIPVMVGFNWPTHPLVAALAPAAAAFLTSKELNIFSIVVGGAGIASGVGLWFLEDYLETKLRLDYLSFEFEYYGWPHSLGFGDVNQFRVMYPIPPSVQDYPGSDPLAYKKKDNWKYSVNFKKTVVNGFSIIGQVACDHTHYDAYYTKFNTGYFSNEAFTLTNDWGWWVKLQYSL